MEWIFILEIIYLLAIGLICLRIIYDTNSPTKTLAYLLLTIFLPVFGAAFYFSFGINYRKRKMYSKKLTDDEEVNNKMLEYTKKYSLQAWKEAPKELQVNSEITQLLLNNSTPSPVTNGNKVEIYINGEEKFPAVIEALKNAKHHIHIEYYIYENDVIGNTIKDLLIQKAQEGVKVRFIFDDFGARPVRQNMLKDLRAAGVEAYPFHRVIFWALANRLNYRNHRKLIIIDGLVAFTGGVNVCDKYINNNPTKLYWRDTHMRLEGNGVLFLQSLFLTDWNFCSNQKIKPDESFFIVRTKPLDNKFVQVAASGPDSPMPVVLYAILQIIAAAKKEILITTPYFIPGESLKQSLIVAALSGIKVKLIVPGNSDSCWVNAAAKSYYTDLLEAGVEIYLYTRGFVHAKTIVTDSYVSVIGTANMDHRSFDLNFEVNTHIYDKETAEKMRTIFYEDLHDCEQILPEEWAKRPWYSQLFEKIARLLSPLL